MSKDRKYRLSYMDSPKEAGRLLEEGCGVIDRIEVLDDLLELLQDNNAEATFVQTNGKEINSKKVSLLREEFGFDFLCKYIFAEE